MTYELKRLPDADDACDEGGPFEVGNQVLMPPSTSALSETTAKLAFNCSSASSAKARTRTLS
jgi:hypothetical protein